MPAVDPIRRGISRSTLAVPIRAGVRIVMARTRICAGGPAASDERPFPPLLQPAVALGTWESSQSIDRIPCPRRERKLPLILSRQFPRGRLLLAGASSVNAGAPGERQQNSALYWQHGPGGLQRFRLVDCSRRCSAANGKLDFSEFQSQHQLNLTSCVIERGQ